MLIAKLVITLGLISNIVGVVLLAWDLILTKEEAIALAALYAPSKTHHEKHRLLEVQEALSKSRHAQIGLVLFAVGFLGQLLGTWLQS